MKDKKEVRERLSAEIEKAVAVLNAYGQCKKADSLEKAYAEFSQPSSEGSGEVGLRWVLCAERLPGKPGRYFIKTDRQFVPDSNEVNQVARFTAHKEWYLENHHHSNDFFWCNPYEWLEEYTLPSNSNVEDKDATEFYRGDFQAYADRILRDRGASNSDVEKSINETICELNKKYKITKR